LNGEDCEQQERERTTCGVGPSNGANVCDDSSATIPIFQHLPCESVMFDINNPVMKPDSLYSNMKDIVGDETVHGVSMQGWNTKGGMLWLSQC
jgi:hypothetical protein